MSIFYKVSIRKMDPSLINYQIHPAVNLSFDDLLTGLYREVDKRTVVEVKHEDLVLFNYTERCTYSKSWNQFTIVARGLIICPEERKIVALPFPKFFNLTELSSFRFDLSFTVSDKMNGSLGIIFYHREWKVATRGSFISPQSKWALNWLKQQNILPQLQPGTTYLVEIIYPENKIIVDYNFEGLILLGGYNSIGKELLDFDIGIPWTEKYDYPNLDAISEVCRTLPCSKEGFVIRFSSGLRIKMKGHEYCEFHKMISGCSLLQIWTVIKDGQDLEVLRRKIPEEFHQFLDDTQTQIETRFAQQLKRIIELHEKTVELTNKELAQSKLSKEEKSLIFDHRKIDLTQAAQIPGPARERIFKLFRPSGNSFPAL